MKDDHYGIKVTETDPGSKMLTCSINSRSDFLFNEFLSEITANVQNVKYSFVLVLANSISTLEKKVSSAILGIVFFPILNMS